MSSAISTTSSTTSASTSGAAAGSALITSTGIGSGLNVSAIVSELTTAEGAGQQAQITSHVTSLNAQISAFGTFNSALSTLQATLTPLETPSALAGFSASIADATVATATAGSDAVAGRYSLLVQNLATNATLTSAPVANAATAAIGAGTLSIAIGSASTTITIDSSNDTLSGIAAAINGAANNPGVSASIITTTAGSRLVLSGTTTGAGNGITVSETDGGAGLASLVYPPTTTTNADGTSTSVGFTQTQAPLDANFLLNGYAATSSSNVVTTALSGVTVNLLAASAASTPTTLTIAPDTANAATSIGTFVTALNGLLSAVQSLTGYNAATQTAGALNGNPTMLAFQNQLANILDTVNPSSSGGAQSLADLGITADANSGTYLSDANTLTSALGSNLTSVEKLLGGPNGVATQMGALLNAYNESGGLLDTISSGLKTGLANAATQQQQLTAQLATYSATLTTEYNGMDTAVAALKETQTYLTAEFNSSSSSSSSTSSLSSGTTST
jgi:flagellar hook-associated protein 2